MTINKTVISLADVATNPFRSMFLANLATNRNEFDSTDDDDDDEVTFLSVVQTDVQGGLEGAFEPVGGFMVLPGFRILSETDEDGRRHFSVPWVYECFQSGPLGVAPNVPTSDDAPDPFAAIPAPETGHVILIEGVTVGVQVDTDQFAIRRYVDWNLVLAQLGATTSIRGSDPAIALTRTLEEVRNPTEVTGANPDQDADN